MGSAPAGSYRRGHPLGRFGELRAEHQRKPSLLDRFDQAGLPR